MNVIRGEGLHGAGSVRPRKPMTQLLEAPSEGAPVWVKLLMMLARQLPLASVSGETGVRGVVAGPTGRHLPAALATTAVRPPNLGEPSILAAGLTVATVVSKDFRDLTVGRLGARLNLGGTQMNPTGPLPPAILLDPSWEFERGDHMVPEAAEVPCRLLDPGSPAGRWRWTYQRLCLNPVLVITHRPGQVVQDLHDLASVPEWWNPVQRASLADPGEGVDAWFRRPVIVTSPGAILTRPWLRTLPVSMVVVAGFATWMTPARHVWPLAPHVLLLNQRSGDVADFRDWFDGTDFPVVEFTKLTKNRRMAGITITAFGELVAPLSVTESEGDDEWEF